MTKLYKELIMPLVWLGVYSSVRDAEQDSMLQLLRFSSWTSDKELIKRRYEIGTTLVSMK